MQHAAACQLDHVPASIRKGAPMTIPDAPPPVQVIPPEGSELARLVAQRPAAKAAAKEADDRVKDNKAEILAAIVNSPEVRAATAANAGIMPGRILVTGAAGVPGQKATWHGNERTFDRKKFDADFPGLYEKYLIPAQGFWELREK